jgi:AcrR family transcriptional regulator
MPPARTQGAHVVEMQRRRLLSALSEVLADEGLEGASAGRVCARAGMSRRTFYELFADREGCLLAALEDAIERVGACVMPAFVGGGSWRERVRGALVALLEAFERQPALARLCMVEAPKGGVAVVECHRRSVGLLVAAVDEGRRELGDGVEPLPLCAEATVGGVLAVVHARLVQREPGALVELVGPLMSMIVHPYLGVAAARAELELPVPAAQNVGLESLAREHAPDPFRDLRVRITFRTARVLETIGENPGANNRQIGEGAGIADQGQVSKLLHRLDNCGLVVNRAPAQPNGRSNVWRLTERGRTVLAAIGEGGRNRARRTL